MKPASTYPPWKLLLRSGLAAIQASSVPQVSILLYGINNINRFLQESNPNEAVQWGIQQYKIGDPVLFNESDRFAPVIYNNMKGKIVGIEVFNPDEAAGYIQFDIELAKVINGMDAWMCDFELLGMFFSPRFCSRMRSRYGSVMLADEASDPATYSSNTSVKKLL